MYGLAAHKEQDEKSARWMDIAAGITNTCHESYDRTDTKLGPEAFRFSNAIEARALKQMNVITSYAQEHLKLILSCGD